MNTVEWIIWTVTTVGMIFIYAAKIIYYGYCVFVWFMSITFEKILNLIAEHPILFGLSWFFALLSCALAGIFFLKGLKRIFLPLLLIIIGTIITTLTGIGLAKMWKSQM